MQKFFVLGMAAIMLGLSPVAALAQSDTAAAGNTTAPDETVPLKWPDLRRFSRGRIMAPRDYAQDRRPERREVRRERRREGVQTNGGPGRARANPARIRHFKAKQKKQRRRAAAAGR